MEERRVRQRVSLLPRLVKAVRRLIYITRAYTRNMLVYLRFAPTFDYEAIQEIARPDSPLPSRFARGTDAMSRRMRVAGLLLHMRRPPFGQDRAVLDTVGGMGPW